MRTLYSLSLLTCLAIGSSGGALRSDDPAEFFNGKDLAGWDGLTKYWKISEGAIVGTTLPDGIGFNTFLCSRRKYRDFDLNFQVRLKGGVGNSGVQIRSEVFDREKMAVKGPQCDIGDVYWGSLYGEHFGGMMKQAPSDVVKKVLKSTDFNDYSIRCVGKHVTIKLNGQTTVDAEFANLPAEGIIAWQLHGGPAMEVTFRNIRFKDLSSK